MKKQIFFLVVTMLLVTVLAGCSWNSAQKLEDGSENSFAAEDSRLAKHIPSLLLVKTESQSEIDKIVEQFAGTVLETIAELDVYKIRLGRLVNHSLVATMKEIQEIAQVEYVEPVYVYQSTLELTDTSFDSAQWGPQAIGLEQALDIATNPGYGITIAILDTGIDYTHPEFDNRVVDGYNFVNDMSGIAAASDDVGHGTHVAGIAAANINSDRIAGIAPESDLLSVKVLGETGGESTWISDGIIWAVNNGAQIINMSLGGKGYSQTMQDAVDYAITNGVVVVAAMGNSGNNEFMYPAAYSGVIAVGAANGRNEVADFSTRGRHISVVAPGVDILSTVPGSMDSYARFNGTSMATPHVTGAIALLLSENPLLTVAEVKARLEHSAADLGTVGFDEDTGWGMVDLVNLLADNAANPFGDLDVMVTLDGSALEGAEVLVIDEWDNSTVKNLKTDATGYAYFHHLEPGTYTVIVTYDNSQQTLTTVEVQVGVVTSESFAFTS